MALLLWVLMSLSGSTAGEIDWTRSAPDEEIAAACDILRDHFGDELYKSSVHQVSSGVINSEEEVTGYFVCFHYCPPSVFGRFAPLCLERYLDRDFGNAAGGICQTVSSARVNAKSESGIWKRCRSRLITALNLNSGAAACHFYGQRNTRSSSGSLVSAVSRTWAIYPISATRESS